MQITEANNYRQTIEVLLAAEKLPVADLPKSLANFRVVIQGDQVTGVAGIEIYGDYGLLRSMAVKPDSRNQGIAGTLLNEIEVMAAAKGLTAIYLLTETAPEYFRGKGYIQIARAGVPAEVQASSEFSHVCPQSAIVMKKTLSV